MKNATRPVLNIRVDARGATELTMQCDRCGRQASSLGDIPAAVAILASLQSSLDADPEHGGLWCEDCGRWDREEAGL